MRGVLAAVWMAGVLLVIVLLTIGALTASGELLLLTVTFGVAWTLGLPGLARQIDAARSSDRERPRPSGDAA